MPDEDDGNVRVLRRANGEDRARKRPKLICGDEIRAADEIGTIVKGLLYAGSLTLIYGPPKSGKSFLATDLALNVADQCDDWMGHRIVRAGPVVYLACEGHGGFWKRCEAAARTRGRFPPSFILVKDRPHLVGWHGKGVVPQSDELLMIAHDCRELFGSYPVAMVIDTVYRSFGSGSINNPEHMSCYIAALNPVLALSIAVIAVHHETKAGGSYTGSNALGAAADTIIKTTGEDQEHAWEVEFAKDDASTKPRAFALDVVEVGTDCDGEPASSCVVRDGGQAPTGTKKQQPRDKSMRELIRIGAREAYVEILDNQVPIGKMGDWIKTDLVRARLVHDELLELNEKGHISATSRSQWRHVLAQLKERREFVVKNGQMRMII